MGTIAPPHPGAAAALAAAAIAAGTRSPSNITGRRRPASSWPLPQSLERVWADVALWGAGYPVPHLSWARAAEGTSVIVVLVCLLRLLSSGFIDAQSLLALVTYVGLLAGKDLTAKSSAVDHGGGYPWRPEAVVLLTELLKLMASICLRLAESRIECSATGIVDVRPWWWTAASIAPVALTYAVNNVLALYALSLVDLRSYVIWRNTAIVFNALFWVLWFRRPLGTNQMLAVVGFMCAAWLSSITRGQSAQLAWPTLLVVFSTFLSVCAAVLNECVLKSKTLCAELSINGLNIMLYAQTSAALALAIATRAVLVGNLDVIRHVFQDLDMHAALIIFQQAILGIVVSRVLAYASSMAKSLASRSRDMVLIVVGPYFISNGVSTSTLDYVALALAGASLHLYSCSYALHKEDAAAATREESLRM